MRAAVVGGGVSGLAAAWELASSGCEVTVYEPGHLGGKLLTSPFLGRPVDEGPDSLLTRVPEGVALCEELGLGGELEAPVAKEVLVFSGGKLYRLPQGLVLGAPARLGPLVRSRALSPAGLARAAADLVLPARALAEDESVWDLVASRFGREVAQKLVEPLVGAVYAGSIRGLSAAAAAPQLLSAAKSGRSLFGALRRASAARPGSSPGPAFLAPRSGMQALADRLAQALRDKGASFVPSEVTALRLDGRRVVLEPAGEHFDGAVVAVPAWAAHRLLAAVDAELAGLSLLSTLEWASVGVVTLALEEPALGIEEALSGILVPRGEGALVTACTFGSNKWPRWRVPGAAVVRLSVGRAGDARWSALSDEALVERCLADLSLMLKANAGPRHRSELSVLSWRVSRWPSALPQYPVGHLQQVASLKEALRRRTGALALAGASYGKVGVPACIASGRQAARELLGALEPATGPAS